MAGAEKKAPIDWERVELEYRAGVLSLREIASIHGCSHVAVNKRAKAAGWTRDLSAKIKAKAEELVNKAAVTEEVTEQRRVNEREVIEANALRIAQVQSQHRADIGRARRLSMKLLNELEAATDNVPELVALGEMLRSENANGVDRLNDVYQAVISLPERTKTMKALSESLKNLVGLEREAYGIESLPQTIKTENVGAPANAASMDPIEAAKAYRQFIAE